MPEGKVRFPLAEVENWFGQILGPVFLVKNSRKQLVFLVERKERENPGQPFYETTRWSTA